MNFGAFQNFDTIFASFGDIFNEFFGFNQRPPTQHRPRPGKDLLYHLEIDFQDAVFGLETSVEISRTSGCHHCQGQGHLAPNGQPRNCSCCQGYGTISRMDGFFRINSTCPHCAGTGAERGDPCPQCQGQGVLPQRKQATLKIPAGVDDGTRLRLRGEGDAGQNGGPPGDLYIDLKVKPHPLFQRDGNNLIHRAQVSFVDAALGAEITIPTLTGSLPLTVPPGTQSETRFTLYGEGVPVLRGAGRGNLIVELELRTPTNLTPRQEDLLRKFLASTQKKTTPKTKSRRNKSLASKTAA
jgi:molecular chaperone DnaJ